MDPGLEKINHHLNLAMQSGQQFAFDWLIPTDELRISDGLPACFQYVPLRGLRTSVELMALVHADDQPAFMQEIRRALKDASANSGFIHHLDFRLKDEAIGWRWASFSGQVVERDQQQRAVRAVGIFADISTRKLHEQRITRLRNMYAALSQTNQAILRTRNQAELFNEICRIAVEHGHFQMAMIRLIDFDNGDMIAVAGHGKSLEHAPIARISIDADKPEGRGPAGTSIRDQRPSICNDFQGAPFHQDWQSIAAQVGFRSVGSFPFRQFGKIIGTLLLYSESVDYFDAELIHLLEDMAGEITFALDQYAHEAQRIATQVALANSEKFKDAILLAALDCIVSFDADGRIIAFNPAAERTFGYRSAEVIGKPFTKTMLAPAAQAQFDDAIAGYAAQGGNAMLNCRLEVLATDADQMQFPAEIAITPITLSGQPVFTAYLRDISELKQSQAILQDSEARYRQLVDLSPEAIFVHQNKKFVLLNAACVELLGASHADELLGQDVTRFMHPKYQATRRKRALTTPKGELRSGFVDEVLVRLDGSIFDVELAASKFIYFGEPAVQIVMRDITARKLAEELQLAQSRILQMIAMGDALPDILTGLLQFIETQSERCAGAIQLLDADGKLLQAGHAPALAPTYNAALAGCAIGPSHASFGTAIYRGEAVISAAIDDDPLWHEWRAVALAHQLHACASWPIFGKHNKVLGTLSIYFQMPAVPNARELRLIDLATNLAGIAIENKESEDKIRYLAHYDELTSLPNRTLFNQLLGHAMKTAQRHHNQLFVLFVDLDRFKNINDTFGHDAGDQTLLEISERLRNCVRATDTVARMGGDEFYILLEDQADERYAATVAQKILDETVRPFYIDNQECQLSASIGIAIYPNDGEDALSLLKNSDIAMYRAKNDGKNAYRFYAASQNTHSLERMALESQLRRAIENREFVLYYQPKVELATGHIKGVEALVRWQHPELGLLLPGHFISLAEETRLIIPLSKLILQIACADARTINAASPYPIRVAVNLSARQFEEEDFLSGIREQLIDSGLDPDLLQLELTESMVMNNPEHAVRIMKELQGMHIRLDIDDFGTGYSSLAYLKRFPLYSLKIDRSFIQDIPGDPNDTAITQAIIAMGHSLGMRVIAEGVETAEQMQALRQFGCDEFQGFHFSRPIPLAQVLALLTCHTSEMPAHAPLKLAEAP